MGCYMEYIALVTEIDSFTNWSSLSSVASSYVVTIESEVSVGILA